MYLSEKKYFEFGHPGGSTRPSSRIMRSINNVDNTTACEDILEFDLLVEDNPHGADIVNDSFLPRSYGEIVMQDAGGGS